MIEIIGDPGSCHMGRMDLAKDLIKVGAACGLDAVKFQLLEPAQLQGGNVLLPWAWLPELGAYGADLGIPVFASIFSTKGLGFLEIHQIHNVKFPYRQWNLFQTVRSRLNKFKQVYISTDCMRPAVPKIYKTLYCLSEYPVPYVPNFEGLFPRFDGFSSHCLGIQQDLSAIAMGATIIEKHYTLDQSNISCPDHQFSIRPPELKTLCDQAHSSSHIECVQPFERAT